MLPVLVDYISLFDTSLRVNSGNASSGGRI